MYLLYTCLPSSRILRSKPSGPPIHAQMTAVIAVLSDSMKQFTSHILKLSVVRLTLSMLVPSSDQNKIFCMRGYIIEYTNSSKQHHKRLKYVGPERTSTRSQHITYTGMNWSCPATLLWSTQYLSIQRFGSRPNSSENLSTTAVKASHLA